MAYDLICRLNAQKVLIVTNRPAVENTWYDDFKKFIKGKTDYKFMSDNEALKDKFFLTHKKYFYTKNNKRPPVIAFESLQNLKGAEIYGGEFDKLRYF